MKLFLTLLVMSFGLGNSPDKPIKNHKYTTATVLTHDGEVLKGLVQMPINHIQKQVPFKKDLEADTDFIKVKDIDMLRLESGKGALVLKRSKFTGYGFANPRANKKATWLEMRMSCEDFQTYVLVGAYDMDKEGNFYQIFYNNEGLYLIQRNGESHPFTVGVITARKQIFQGVYDKNRKKRLISYYENDKEAREFFKSMKKVTQDDLIEYLDQKCQ